MPQDTRHLKERLTALGVEDDIANGHLDATQAQIQDATEGMAEIKDLEIIRQGFRADLQEGLRQMQNQLDGHRERMQGQLDSQRTLIMVGFGLLGALVALVVVFVAIAGF